MRLIEFMESHLDVTVYHGARSPSLAGELQTPFFCTPIEKMARSYAIERGRGSGAVFEFRLSSDNVATEETVYEVAAEIGIDHSDYSAADLVSPQVTNEADEIIDELLHRGFKCVFMKDLGFDCPFTEHDAYCVLDSTILRDPKIVEQDL